MPIGSPALGIQIRPGIIPVAVLCLLLGVCPATIRQLVVSVSIWETIDGMIGARSSAHVCEEGFERILPATANPDSAATIAMPLGAIGIRAPLAHRTPSSIFLGSQNRLSMDSVVVIRTGHLLTSTRCGFSGSEMIDARRNHLPAFAPTGESTPSLVGSLDDSEPSEFLSNNGIVSFCHIHTGALMSQVSTRLLDGDV